MLVETQLYQHDNISWNVTGRRHLPRTLAARRGGSRHRPLRGLPDEMPVFADGAITLYTSASNAETLDWTVTDRRRLSEYFRAHLRRAPWEEWLALLVHIDVDEAAGRLLTAIGRMLSRDERPGVDDAVPGAGVVLRITCDATRFAPLPRRGWRVLRVHLGADVVAGLVTFQAALANARAEST